MSDDLISRKALMERVLQEEYDNDIHKDGRAKAIHHGEYQHFYKTIAETPTAYDVDKVIEQLNQKAEDTMKYWKEFDDEDAFGEMNAYKNAIEIVKSGGVADD